MPGRCPQEPSYRETQGMQGRSALVRLRRGAYRSHLQRVGEEEEESKMPGTLSPLVAIDPLVLTNAADRWIEEVRYLHCS